MRNIILLSDNFFFYHNLGSICISRLYLIYSRLNKFNYFQNDDNNIVGISAQSSVLIHTILHLPNILNIHNFGDN